MSSRGNIITKAPSGRELSAELTEGAGGMNEFIYGGLLPSR